MAETTLEEWAAETAARMDRGEILCSFCGKNPAKNYHGDILGAGMFSCGGCPREGPIPVAEPFGGEERCDYCDCDHDHGDGVEDCSADCPGYCIGGLMVNGRVMCWGCYDERLDEEEVL